MGVEELVFVIIGIVTKISLRTWGDVRQDILLIVSTIMEIMSPAIVGGQRHLSKEGIRDALRFEC